MLITQDGADRHGRRHPLGGAMRSTDLCILGELPLDPVSLEKGMADPGCGGLVCFIGRVRDEHLGRAVLHLSYEAFVPLALRCLRELADEARQRWALGPLVLAHRVGRLEVGEAAVYIGVAGGHRGECFDACRFLIEGVKDRVPIWKHEFYADGSDAWVGAPGWREAKILEARL
jgi:molybdopterin synthase catalytic subunit